MSRHDPILAEVLRYWDGLRQGDTLPARQDLDPKVIQHALGNAFILDRTRPGTLRIRVAGRHLNDLMGMEVRGMPLRALFELMERRRVSALVEEVFTRPSLLEIDVTSQTEGCAQLAGRMLLLPMTDADGAVTKALGCLVTEGQIGTPPRRFSLARHVFTPIGPANPGGVKPLIAGFAEAAPARPYVPRPTPVAATEKAPTLVPGPVPYLRIVE